MVLRFFLIITKVLRIPHALAWGWTKQLLYGVKKNH